MNKRLRICLILLIIVAILIPIYVFVINPDSNDSQKGSESKNPVENQTQNASGDKSAVEILNDQGRPFIIEPMSEDDISVLKVTNAYGGFEFYRGTDGQMYLRGAEKHLYNAEMQKYLYKNAATYLLAIEKLEDYDDLSVYGLTDQTASAIVEITDINNYYYKIYFGNKVVTDGAFYARLEGRDTVYVVDTMIESVLLCPAQDYIYPLQLPAVPQDDFVSIEALSIDKNGEPFIAIEKMSQEQEEQSTIFGQYKMVFPSEYTPSSDNITGILQSFTGFVADKVLEYTIDDEKLDKYGLKTGTKYKLSYKYNGVEYVLYFSDKTENGTYYIYSPLFDIISEISADKVTFLEWDFIKFVDRNIFMMDIDKVSAIDISYNNTTDSFRLKGEKDELTVTCNGNKTDTKNFRYLYKSLLSIVIDGYETMPENSAPSMTMKITTRNDQILLFEFYDVGAVRSFFTLNGSGQFYVHRDCLRTVIDNISKLKNGQMIE